MPRALPKACCHPGCPAKTHERFCVAHKKANQKRVDQQRGTAHERGYTSRWARYSRWFLRQPENVVCTLKLKGCTTFAQCVDHIDPPNGPNDPRFWDKTNHQAACIHCNSAKGHRKIVGKGGVRL